MALLGKDEADADVPVLPIPLFFMFYKKAKTISLYLCMPLRVTLTQKLIVLLCFVATFSCVIRFVELCIVDLLILVIIENRSAYQREKEKGNAMNST